MLSECLEALAIKPNGVYVDATMGGAGHTQAILNLLGPQGKLLAFDQDADALANAPKDERLVLCNANFRFVENFVNYHQTGLVDGILADLGVSSYQIDTPNRGFATRYDAPLDMRMNTQQGLSAYQVVNTYDEESLSTLIFRYGELRNARQMARLIVLARAQAPIETTGQLLTAVDKAIPGPLQAKFGAMLFQAIRIEVNAELEVLQHFLRQTPKVLKPSGRLVVMAYHSLEDRLVKNFMRAGNFKGVVEKDFFGNPQVPFKPLGKYTASKAELAENPRARSAVLRVAERTEHSV